MDKKVFIVRTEKTDTHIKGVLFVVNKDARVIFYCSTLELPYRDNQRRISSIPPGVYPAKWEYSAKFKRELWEFKGVPGRYEIKIHVGNYAIVPKLEGCILVGQYFKDINSDGIPDITNSGYTLGLFHTAMGDQKETIITVYG